MSDPFPIGPTGIWDCADLQHYPTDEPLVAALIDFFKRENILTIIDLGCGSGNYVNALNAAKFLARGIDGNPNSPKWSDRIDVVDLTKRIDDKERVFQWVLCLEVGEHIPREFEEILLDNINHYCLAGAIISWFPDEGHGIGHVNPRSNEWLTEQMQKRGFNLDGVASIRLRVASTMWWYAKSLQVYRRASNYPKL